MKTTVEIDDNVFERAQALAQSRNTSLSVLVEAGLELILTSARPAANKELPPLVTFKGIGLAPGFGDVKAPAILDEFYRGRGA